MMYDLVGIGAGPFNLSLAALLEPTGLKTCFLERQKQYQWHPGMMLPGAKLQNSYLRDLVTGVDPTNRHSFLNYLVESGRFYRFLHADQSAVSRQEFDLYLKWASSRMEHVRSGGEVREVDYCEQSACFQVRLADNSELTSKHLSLGTGKKAKIPPEASSFMGNDCFHASEIALRKLNLAGKRIAVVGGGQSGAEIFLNLINDNWGKPAAVTWISRRNNLAPLDETPFTNEFFAPGYQEAFILMPPAKKDQLLSEQKLASDGISGETLRDIYQSLYQREVSLGLNSEIQIKPSRELTNVSKIASGFEVAYVNKIDEQWESTQVDVVLLCTGYQYHVPTYLYPLAEKFDCDASYGMALDPQYRVRWEGNPNNRIYALNMGLMSHGIVDPQMSLNAVRAATIVNDLSSEAVYQLSSDGYLQWQSLTSESQTFAA